MTIFFGVPSQVQQFKHFLKSFISLRGLGLNPHTLLPIITGLMIIIPDEVRNSGILENPKQIKVASKLLDFLLVMNDRLDFELSGRKDISKILYEGNKREANARKKLALSIHNLSDSEEQLKLERIINSCRTESEVVEKYVRKSSRELDFNDAIIYRRLVNAIMICVVTNVILKDDSLSKRLERLEKEDRNYEKVYKKYEWIFSDNPKSHVEKAIVVMDRMTTMAQLDDDWFGRHIDVLLYIPSPAIVALRDAVGDEEKAYIRINKTRKFFINEAKRQGLANIPIDIFAFVFRELMRFERNVTIIGKSHPKLFNILEKIPIIESLTHLPPREDAYIEGKLEVK